MLMRLRLKGAHRLMRVENLSTGIEASATGESLNSGYPAVHPAGRKIPILVTPGSAGGISAEKSGLDLRPCVDTDAWRGFKLWQLQSAAGLCVIQF